MYLPFFSYRTTLHKLQLGLRPKQLIMLCNLVLLLPIYLHSMLNIYKGLGGVAHHH